MYHSARLLLQLDYTDLSVGTVTQTQAIPFTGPISLLVSQLRNLAGDVQQVEGAEKITVRIFDSVTLVHEAGMVMLEWLANPLNDMYADAITTVVLEVQSNPNAQKFLEGRKEAFDMEVFLDRLELMLHDMFGDDCVHFKDSTNLCVTVGGATATVDPEKREVTCPEDETLREMLEVSVQRLYDALTPSF
ncbi:cleavage and polyadenylation specificity factor subunit 3-like [Nematolebias whitei]|uniref:cleavage and polyadenylation specificity factor subunit 3-like n=1 Tax=Nematolebias whitei TaxID=451745 RepID=UPI001899B3CD|nr:cleavage and polyadenylation specificity factor subunit 3-like [Nematolebias whitei]